MFEAIRSAYFPAELIPGIEGVPIEDRDAFWRTTGPQFEMVFRPFEQLGAYVRPDARWAAGGRLRAAMMGVHQEYFLFQSGAELAGWSYGQMRDSETFFMSNTAILPTFRRRGLYSAFLERLIAYLGAVGYERIVSNHQPNNRAVLIAKLKAGFSVSAVNLDERWGAQVELMYHVHEDRRRGYERAFALQAWDVGKATEEA